MIVSARVWEGALAARVPAELSSLLKGVGAHACLRKAEGTDLALQPPEGVAVAVQGSIKHRWGQRAKLCPTFQPSAQGTPARMQFLLLSVVKCFTASVLLV